MSITDELRGVLPPIVPRSDIDLYIPGVYSARTMANLDSRGRGPRRVRIGGKVCYKREDLCEWLEDNSRVLQ